MKYITLIMLVLGFHVEAKIVDNYKAVEIYQSQLKETQSIFHDTQQTLMDSAPVMDMYQLLGYATPDVIAISKRFLALQDRAKKLYGEDIILTPTPFNSCAALPSIAYTQWIERVTSLKSDNTSAINSLAQSYINKGKECVDSMKNPPPKQIEEDDNPQIIDVEE